MIDESRANGACLSGKCIKTKSLAIAKELGLVNFKASSGWLDKFLKRNNLVLRRISSRGRALPTNSVDVIRRFIEKSNDVNSKRSLDKIYNFDESTIYLDSPENYTYEKRGTKRVVANTSGNERTRISITICASALGTKLPLVVIVPRKRPLKDFNPPQNVVIIYKPNGTFDSETIKTGFLQRVFLPHVMQKAQKNPILYLDSAPCHVSSSTTEFMDDLNFEYSFIPPRLTSLLQPADVCWLKSFKKCYYEKWTQWFLNDSKSFTKSGNLRSPGYAKAIGWLSEIWDEFDSSIIKTSFEVCGITSDNDDDFHSTLKTFLQSGPIEEYLETNDGENDIDGFDNHCEKDDDETDQDDDEEDISEDEGLEDGDQVESCNDSVEEMLESNVDSDTQNESLSSFTNESNTDDALDDTIESSSSDDNALYILNTSNESNFPQNKNNLGLQKVKHANRFTDGINNDSIGNLNKRNLEENSSLRRSKRIKKV